jgi:hypothetical protein
LALVEYVGKFPGLGPHGNSRQQGLNCNLRTPDYVMDKVIDLLAQEKPKQVYDKLAAKYDKVSRPSNIQKIRDRKKYDKDRRATFILTHAHILTLETMVSNNHHDVRSIIRNNGKTPCFILYTDEQLADLQNFCCQGHTVIGTDKTFNLCDMHVTVTCYKQLRDNRQRTDKHPVFLRSIYLHGNSDFESYCHFLIT